MADFHRVIGIDLGTTFSVVAAYNFAKQEVKVIPNRQNEPTTPSVVYIAQDGRVSVGRPAREKLAKDPGRVVFEAKRLMGEQEDGKKAMVRTAGQIVDPELISAYILKELKSFAEMAIGAPIHDAVITVPARFKEPQKNATREAAKIAKLNPRLIINEPTAAAVAYGLESAEPQTFAVFDFGGGTFDVSVVRILNEQTVEVLGTGGDPHLGGGDIDQAIVNWALARLRKDHGEDFSGNERLVGRLRLKAEQVKIHLCNEKQDQEFFLENLTPRIEEINYKLTVGEFEKMVAPLMTRALAEVDVAMASAASRHGLTTDDIDAFILVGGSSRMPMVQRMLTERYRKPIKADLNPDEIVAMGAARMAQNFEPSLGPEILDHAELKFDNKPGPRAEEVTDTHIKDVVSHTLGIGLKDDVYDPLIAKDSVIPHRVVRKGYTTAYDNQANILVPVYQGDNPKASQNFLLGEVIIDGLTPGPKGSHHFQVTFALDADGIFSGDVLHQETNSVKDIKLDRGQGAMTEKKRIALSEVVERGVLVAPGQESAAPAPPANATVALIAEANQRMTTLRVDKQRELAELLRKLEDARAARDDRAVGLACGQLALFLAQHGN
jgi:molecular chaperone DnaK